MGMNTIRYRYCWNSTNYAYSETADGFIPNHGAERHPDHIPSCDGYLPGNSLTLAYEGEVADSNLEVIDRETAKVICEHLYVTFNAPWARPAIFAGPSMSIGDVVTLFLGNGAILDFACSREGFTYIERIDDTKIGQRPRRWMRDADKLKAYLQQKEAEVGLTPDEEFYLNNE